MQAVVAPTSISVVLPTFNRRERLEAALAALAHQVVDIPVELVVVSDGSTDGTDEMLAAADLGVPLRHTRQDNAGPAAARNAALGMATGELVVFVDDDVVAAAGMLQAHVDAHRRHGDETVVIGPMLDPPAVSLVPWVRWEQAMLRKQYAAMEAGDYTAGARQFYTGNASVLRRHVAALGGFDAQFRRAEDVELAHRLADRGLHFWYERTAIGYHHADRSFASWLATAAAYGRSEVIFARDHDRPALLRFVAYKWSSHNGALQVLTAICVRWPSTKPPTVAALRAVSRVGERAGIERFGVERVVQHALSAIHSIEYHSALAAELGGQRPFFRLLLDERKRSRAT